MKRQLSVFVLRWILSSFGLWIAVRLFGNSYEDTRALETVWLFLSAGFIFSIINSILRPLLIIVSLPAILLTLGLFTLLVNGFLVYLALLLMPESLSMGFWHSVLAGIILSLLNYIVSTALELQRDKRENAEEKII